ncbi:MAG: PKD domain-containing protein [Holophagales bacterium]|nr:PKD domain-containing protein [Holophagales bacterium]
MRRVCLSTALLSLCLACARASPDPGAGAAETTAPGQTAIGGAPASGPPAAVPSQLDRGFVVWESNRGDAWQLWREDLGDAAGSGPHALTPAEPSRAHCCPHISPDGRRLAYLSLPIGQAGYPRSGAAGELRLLELAPPGESLEPGPGRPLAQGARTYFEHRAAVWHDEASLIHIDDRGRTVLLDVDAGTSRPLVTASLDAHGWLLDPGLSFATRGEPSFSPYDGNRRAVNVQASLGGCQPYFSGDGRLGIWVAGAGGPVRALELASGRQWPILGKGDERLPADRRYLYFPMPSRDGRALAWAASDGAHDHTRADYDVFVAGSDSETLELDGPPAAIGRHPATDRFPDVWLAPLELGSLLGEAPFTVRLEVPRYSAEGEPWSWSFGDGGKAEGPAVEHTWTEAGSFEVSARRGTEELRGRARVRPRAPPRLLEAETRSADRRILLRFDEAVDVSAATVSLAGGPEVSARGLDGDRTWELELATPLVRPTELRVRGVRDLAEPPNVLEETSVRLEPPRWPAAPEDLVFLWQTARHPNRVRGPGGEAQTTLLEPVGRAFVDRHGAVVLSGGVYQADLATMDRLYHGSRATNELSLEMVLTPESSPEAPGALFGFAAGSRRNLTLTQEEDRLKLRLHTASAGPRGPLPAIDLGPAEVGVSQHLALTYTPGHLRAYLNGEPTVESREMKSGFFHWQRTFLRLGGEGPPQGAGADAVHWPWRGRLEGVAIYDRVLSPEEVRESFRRYAEIITRRQALETVALTGRLRARSRTPSLEEIAPYREALAVAEYEVLRVETPASAAELRPGGTVRVAHRVLLAGEETPVARLSAGAEVALRLEPFSAQPQLESLFLSDELSAGSAGSAGGELYWSEQLRP